MRGVRPSDMSVPAIESGEIMTTEETSMGFGWRVYGLGVMALGLVCLAWGDFDPGQPVPRGFPDRTAMAYAAAAFMFVAGAAIEWRRAAAWGAAALTAYYLLIVVILLNGRVVLAHYAEFGAYSGAAEQLAIAAGGLIVYASTASIDAARAARLTRLGQLAFGACALLFGGAHFFYMNLTAPLNNSARSEEHTSELQSHSDLVCRLLLEKKKITQVLVSNSQFQAPVAVEKRTKRVA